MLMSSRYPKASTEDVSHSAPAAKSSNTTFSTTITGSTAETYSTKQQAGYHYRPPFSSLSNLPHGSSTLGASRGETATGCWYAVNAQPASPRWPQTSCPKGCWASHKLSVPRFVAFLTAVAALVTGMGGNGGCKTEELLCQAQGSSRSTNWYYDVPGNRGKGEDRPRKPTDYSLTSVIFVLKMRFIDRFRPL